MRKYPLYCIQISLAIPDTCFATLLDVAFFSNDPLRLSVSRFNHFSFSFKISDRELEDVDHQEGILQNHLCMLRFRNIICFTRIVKARLHLVVFIVVLSLCWIRYQYTVTINIYSSMVKSYVQSALVSEYIKYQSNQNSTSCPTQFTPVITLRVQYGLQIQYNSVHYKF